MDDIEEQILSYPHLPDEQQREIEAYVEEHPEWASLLRDVRALESIAREARGAEETASIEPLLEAYVVARYLRPEDTSALGEAFGALERRLEDNPALRERVDAARRRLRSTEAELDPVSQFEELTGHTLSSNPSSQSSSSVAASGAGGSAAPERGSASPIRSVVDRVLALPLAVRGAGAALLVLLGTYAALFVASTASQSPLDRLAAVNVSDQMVESYYSTGARGAGPPSDTQRVDDLYLDALSTLRGARTSTLGLFPSYDTTALRRAEARLKQVLDRTEPGSFLALETQFYLGKVHLAQGRPDLARTRFETVVEREGRRVQDARRILRTLRTEYPGSADGNR